MKKSRPQELIELAIAQQQLGEPEIGLAYCLKAVRIACEGADRESERRGFNVASNCCMLSADYATAIEYGLKAAAIARELKRDDAMLAALTNVTAALTHIGQTEEAVQIAINVVAQFEGRTDCKEDTRTLLTNAAGAQLVEQDFIESMRLTIKAIEIDGEVRDADSARARLIDELNWLTAAIAVDMPNTVDARMRQITAIVEAYPCKGHELRLRLANAIYLNYRENSVYESIGMLESLVVDALGFSTIQVDCYNWLIQLCQKSNQLERANRHQQALIDHRNAKQHARLRRVFGATRSIEQHAISATDTAADGWIKAIINETANYRLAMERSDAILQASKQRALEALSANVQMLHDLTGRSIYRIAKLTSLLSRCIGFTDAQSRSLELSTRLYPIGVSALKTQTSPHQAIAVAATIELGHGEHWNGRGDPLQLSGNEIPEVARIASIAIQYDELTHQRTLHHSEAVRLLRIEKGGEFDPSLLEHFLPLIERLHLQHDHRLDGYLSMDAPQREIGRKAQEELKDVVPGLALLEVA
jgi:HD-GYP domain-containing protein (c-di-GMP phosphodiesterase class II)/Flp pilus assembly pilin Flp